ncbi:MAG: PolC-type DNA polymerase III [Symbiobacteriaceae bacterium]|nr:PolC-type DNA polymerase III [Symbiobacteriaceae bacterium]
MSNTKPQELSDLLRQALPEGYVPLEVVVRLDARQWRLLLQGRANAPPLREQELRELSLHLSKLAGEFQIEVALESSAAPVAETATEPLPELPVADQDLWEIPFEIPGEEETAPAPPSPLVAEPSEPLTPQEFISSFTEEQELLRREAASQQEAFLADLQQSTVQNSPQDIYYGSKPKGKPIPLQEVEGRKGKVVVCGKVFYKTVFTSRNSGISNYRFDITDGSDSLTVKISPGTGRGRSSSSDVSNHRLDAIDKGTWLLVGGTLSEDAREEELVLLADSLTSYPAPPLRRDEAPPEGKRVELHAHTQMSSMDALCNVTDLIATAAHFGHSAIAITDHGVLQAFPEAMAAAKTYGIKVLYGCEIYLVDNPGERGGYYHLNLLAKNQAGLKALYRLVSEAHLNYFYRRPRIPRRLLEEHREHLLLSSACAAGEVYRALYEGYNTDFAQAIAKAQQLAQFYDYLEVLPLGHLHFLLEGNNPLPHSEALQEINQAIISIGQELGKPVVATSDVHFVHPEEAIYREVLQTGQDYDQLDDGAMLYLRTTPEMLAEFAYLDEETAYQVVVTATQEVAAQVEAISPIPNKLFPPTLENADTELRRITEETATKRYGDPLPPLVATRLQHELQCIIGYGYAVTFFIAHKLVQNSLEAGYLVGSRGSVGSSLAACFAGITEVNPLPAHYRCPQCCYSDFSQQENYDCGADLPDAYCPNCSTPLSKEGFNIPFETFMGFEGNKVPDIDLNFSGEYHAEAHRYCEELLGKENVFRAGTISTIGEKTAFGFAMKYLEKLGLTKRKAEAGRLAQGIVGVKRTTGQHPGGLMVVPAELSIYDFTPLQHPADDKGSDIITTHFDFEAIHDCLLKLDLLGHDDPTVLRHLQDITGIDGRTVPLSDPKVLSLFTSSEALAYQGRFRSTTGTLGVPEFGTNFVRGMLVDAQPQNFADLVRISGLSHGTGVWLGNIQDAIKNGTTTLAESISSRDSIMEYLLSKGVARDRAFYIMEAVRRPTGKVTPEDEALMQAHQVPQWYINCCKKITYLFPKAHAVAYVVSAVRIAWYKVYHPQAFYSTYFSIRGNDGFDGSLAVQGYSTLNSELEDLKKKVKDNNNNPTTKEASQMAHLEVACEACARGVKFLPVDLYISHATKYLVEEEGLRVPLSALPGLGASAAQNIVEARAGEPFTSIEDLRLKAKINRAVIDVLQKAGCLKELSETDQLTLI